MIKKITYFYIYTVSKLSIADMQKWTANQTGTNNFLHVAENESVN